MQNIYVIIFLTFFVDMLSRWDLVGNWLASAICAGYLKEISSKKN